MKIIGDRMKALRKSVKHTQGELAKIIGTNISSVNRYDNNQAEAPYKILLAYADYFDVSLDYIYGRTDKPQGRVYDFVPKVENSKEMKAFIDMCFDPESPMSDKLKDTLLKMMTGGEK